MDFEALAGYLPKLNASLHRSYLDERRRVHSSFRPYLDYLDEFTLRGGKRLRALLVLAGYHLATGRSPAPVLPAAVALEHFQSWMLIHDDIIDHAEERRGGPAFHQRVTGAFTERNGIGDRDAFGIGIGITAGDLEEPFTLAALLSTPGSSRTRLAAVREYIQMTRSTAYGQLLDIENGSRPISEISEADVLTVHRLKSAVYTVAFPLRIGAALGSGRPNLLRSLETIGIDLGIAFQLRDDVLGAGFDSESAGKSTNDLIEGKRTLLVVRAWDKGSAEDRALLEQVVGNPRATSQEVDRAREIIRDSGSLAFSEDRIRRLYSRALRQIEKDPSLRPSGKGLLKEIGDRLVHRAS
ncbi:MAG: polyprenyl synthetase family protein [Thermoplasmata archaeon]